MAAVYNEIDPFCAALLRNMILARLIPDGEVDTRRIEDIAPNDYSDFHQVHLFAGLGGWALAARAAGWGDDRRWWSGSCPCQPFSDAGEGGGFADERHLWPAMFHLVDCLRPQRVVGEQVASKNGLAWLDLVHADMEGADYAFRATDLCAAGVGSPNIRQRLWWVGLSSSERWSWFGDQSEHVVSLPPIAAIGGLASADDTQWRPGPSGRDERDGPDAHSTRQHERSQPDGQPLTGGDLQLGNHDGGCSGYDRLADESPGGRREERQDPQRRVEGDRAQGWAPRPVDGLSYCGPGPTNGFWRDADWLYCRDGKWRPVEPGTFPLAHGYPARGPLLRAAGNAINIQAAKAFLECLP